MPSYDGEVGLDRHDLPFDARRIAADLDHAGTATFRYGAFGTGWRMLAIDQEMIEGRSNGQVRSGLVGIESGGYTLWLRDTGNNMHGPWLQREAEHVPAYLAEKYDTPTVDGYGIAVLIALIDGVRAGISLDVTAQRIRAWATRLERPDAIPAFMQNDNRKEHRT